MSEDKVRCTSCGRSFQQRTMGVNARCMYCGGKLAGPGLEHLELVGADGADPDTDDAPRRVEVLQGTGPSRWEQPVLWLHELAVLAMLLMLVSLGVALLVRHDPLLPPSAVRTAMMVLLPLFWLGGICLRQGFELFTGPSRSVLVGMLLLAPGLLLGLPSSLARLLVRLQGKVFGLWGLIVVLVGFVATNSWLDANHDPVVGALAWLEAQPEDKRTVSDWTPSSSGWSGRLTGEGDGGFSLTIDKAGSGTWQGTITWVQSGRVDELRGVHRGNLLAFPYPGPPWVQRWWQRPGMLSTMSLRVVADSQLEGRDLVFGHSAGGQRVWRRDAPVTPVASATSIVPRPELERPPVLPPPVVLRPVIDIDDDQIITGRAFVLAPPGADEPVIVTAASLFGPGGGLASAINPQMLPALMGDALFFDLLDGAMRARGTMRRPPSGARAMQTSTDGPPDVSRDLVALTLLPGHSLEPLSLRDAPVAAGQQLWLPSRPAADASSEESMLAGQVSSIWDHGFSIRFAAGVDLAGHVGAPLLDGQGRVAGMIVGRESGGRGSSLGIAIPARWIAARLE